MFTEELFNPKNQGVGRTAPRAAYIPCASESAALAGMRDESYRLLSGCEWDFPPAGRITATVRFSIQT